MTTLTQISAATVTIKDLPNADFWALDSAVLGYLRSKGTQLAIRGRTTISGSREENVTFHLGGGVTSWYSSFESASDNNHTITVKVASDQVTIDQIANEIKALHPKFEIKHGCYSQ